MNVKLTILERLKDLRVEQHLTLEQLAEKTGLSKSALGNYEADEYKDISPYAITKLAEFYGVSSDYLLGLTENKNHLNTALDELHLGDDAIDAIKAGTYNKRLLSELLAHEKFQRLMIDAEIYVDRIADSRIKDMNIMLDAVRQQAMAKYSANGGGVYMRTLELAQVQTEDYFANMISEDITAILNDIREAHQKDATTADETTTVEDVRKEFDNAMHYEGSPQEKQAKLYLASLGIDYNKLTKEEFVTLIGILKKSKKLQIRNGSQRGRRGSKR